MAQQHFDRDQWGPYDHAAETFIQLIARLIGDRARAERAYELMLDRTGESLAYWLRAEAEDFARQQQDATD